MLIATDYKSSFPVSNGHLETLIPYFFRKVDPVDFTRERINIPDGDFLDIDWKKQNSKKLAVLSHGLEGCSQSNYIRGMSNSLIKQGYDILAWNNRGCSGETNRKLRMYHSGASFDLREVLNHVFETTEYQEIYLVGFSMGGNISLKYLGEEGDKVNPRIVKAVAISTPVSLAECAESLSSGISRVYSKNFILRIVKKLKIKKKQFDDFNPDLIRLAKMWDFESFDDEVTAPINGFINAQHYWSEASSLSFLPQIKVKTLVVNALNDPFLKGKCYPYQELKEHPLVDLETPLRGGHVGFLEEGLERSWIERRVPNFFSS